MYQLLGNIVEVNTFAHCRCDMSNCLQTLEKALAYVVASFNPFVLINYKCYQQCLCKTCTACVVYA